ncbi:hypothetical protein MAPG_05149 [Magnaporthiopsis poae ATCC 64411]|uniref:Non-structural maintenance of chromosomes element 1 homolog n=1 Tax=Magnaporthiopsis poae (strain ATCC 64411 / 73-15) TaxID=644358 RepID=A0A0C4DYM3_MAGP6|nr:hypothetical protein MAPG_05149 [Magnaporthiopsis poae ATCC 64411]
MSWDPPVPPGWQDAHRAFLQALMARGSMTLDDARPVLASIFNQAHDNPAPIATEELLAEDVEKFVRLAREAVSPLDFDIRKLLHQKTKEPVWAFVNVTSDPSTQLATTHTADEISFVKRLLDAIFDTYNKPRLELMCLTEDQALKLSRPSPPRNGRISLGTDNNNNGEASASQAAATDKALKHSEVLALLASLVAEGWLEKSRAGFYSLTPRALMELWAWMNESYNDPDAEAHEWQRIKYCEACKDVLTVGQRCARLECNVRVHDICEDAFWRSRRDRTCPKCRTPWDGEHFVGERAVTAAAASRHGNGRGGGGARRSNVVRPVVEEAEGDDGDE